ncbi:MAG: hypothetical protein EP329_23335 [Deltaproteobacteria bacterium]|nr:MAG: hypothetical protein EP329_23335 [Deltaproteobacteria bacterium]
MTTPASPRVARLLPGLRSGDASRAALTALLLAATLLAGATTVSGCGDDKIVARGGGELDDTILGGGDIADTVSPDGNTQPNGTGREIILLHDTTRPLSVMVTQNQLLRAKVIDYSQGGPASDVTLRFAIVEGGDASDASLSSLSAYTDASGVAGVTFRSGTTADRTYTIQVSADDAPPVRFDVYVADSPRGDLRVSLAYEGPIAVKNVHVRLVNGQFTCGQFSAVYPPIDVVAEKTLLGVGQGDVLWEHLPASERFTVVATAESQEGHLAAAGCIDGVVIVGEQENKVTLTMFLLTLNPTGIYDSTSVFDFTGAIPGQVGELVSQISLLFTSPGHFLIEQVKSIAAAYVGELITNAIFGLFEDTVADVIDDWMFNNSPQWLQDILQVGKDLTQVVNNLEMQAELRISKLSNDYYVQGALLWQGIVLYWHWGCADEGEAGYDPECGRYVFNMQAFQDTEFPMDIIEGHFTATIQNFNQLDIDNHVIKINYGKLIIFVLNEMILPALSGEHNLTDAVLSFVNCPAIADAIGGFSAIGISEQDVEDFCVDGITLIVTPVQIVLGGLALDSQLRMSGNATLLDDDDDLNVDEIQNGHFLGHFESDGQQGSPFTGLWEAVKTPLP